MQPGIEFYRRREAAGIGVASENMQSNDWRAVDNYVEELFSLNDPALEAALEASRAAGLPDISVSPAQGRWLPVLLVRCLAGVPLASFRQVAQQAISQQVARQSSQT